MIQFASSRSENHSGSPTSDPQPLSGSHLTPANTPTPSTTRLPGQYEYESFEEVLRWIRRLTEVHGPRLAVAFDRYIRIRNYFLEEEKEPDRAHIIECIIKNDVGVRRLREDCPEMFQEPNMGREVEFHEGRFLGWTDELSNEEVVGLRAVCAYEI